MSVVLFNFWKKLVNFSRRCWDRVYILKVGKLCKRLVFVIFEIATSHLEKIIVKKLSICTFELNRSEVIRISTLLSDRAKKSLPGDLG